ncbi:TetR/AcrR family transcriptional regulator [Kitasatospora cineracea]|uniref:TetR family transcriptional regulator n=1 Tax=Kitasatospora cineracea TaxID=88074 RepID=A0A3N4RC27_9ACTN|nr:TetR/AcrR family transcriptional regulator [Kitasatospora cineracea]ROR38084.1 TetR family transcriptional regulator [Kitasatospora cineracea]RPE28515.1 TetR family transcriptional regulator [Kitasatospora cineracea]
MIDPRTDGRILRGNQTRRTIVRRAVDIASVEGLDGLSIGRLAADLKLSKSGVFALFGSKEDLQLAAVRAATKIYTEQVVDPSMEVTPGLGRVWTLCERWLDYSEQRVFPGGCFFFSASAEFDSRPGRVRDAVADASRTWQQIMARTITDAVQIGDITSGTNSDQLAYELIALLEAANGIALLHDDPAAYVRSRMAIRARLSTVCTSPALLP